MTEKLDRKEAYEKSIETLKSCMSSYGFLASALKKDNYGRVWARDGVICGLAALMTEDEELIDCFRRTLVTLSRKQHKMGFIPSNVDFVKDNVSYGGTAGRVDASLWYLIGMSQYVKRTGDTDFLLDRLVNLKRIIRMLLYWEFNTKHFLYVPLGGDWADEYINEGYVLYDQLLYLQVNKEYAYLKEEKLKGDATKYKNKARMIKSMIKTNYWLQAKNAYSDKVYNRMIFQKGLDNNLHKKKYLLPYFSPGGYGKRFDAFANTLALCFNGVPKRKQKSLVRYIDKKFKEKTKNLLPAFWPPIKPGDPKWVKLRQNYSIKFRNKAHHYHNGGIWPFVNGFYTAAISKMYKRSSRRHLDVLNWANHKSNGKKKWGFFEYLDSKDFRPHGMKYQAWSAAGGIMAYQAVENQKRVFI